LGGQPKRRKNGNAHLGEGKRETRYGTEGDEQQKEDGWGEEFQKSERGSPSREGRIYAQRIQPCQKNAPKKRGDTNTSSPL